MKALEFMKKSKNFLVYHGSPGIGKTYFCAALVEWYLFEFNSHRYHLEKDLLARLRSVISEDYGDYAKELQYLTDDEFIILDDVGSSINPDKITYKDLEWRREVFFNFLDYRYNNELPTVITSNFTEKEFEQVYSERICSRLFAKENTVISIFGKGLDKRKNGDCNPG